MNGSDKHTHGKHQGTEHYALVRTEDGWRGDPDGYSWQWFDFPELTFTDDGDTAGSSWSPKSSTWRSNSTPTGNSSPSSQTR